MIGAAVVGLGGAYLSFGKIEVSQERRADRAKADRVAAAVAAQVAGGAGHSRLATVQAVLPNDQLVVIRNGRAIFTGPVIRGRDLELVARARFTHGMVLLRDYESGRSGASLLLTLVAAGVILLVILAAWLVATLMARVVRGPIAGGRRRRPARRWRPRRAHGHLGAGRARTIGPGIRLDGRAA
jgi:hypothetical protein